MNQSIKQVEISASTGEELIVYSRKRVPVKLSSFKAIGCGDNLQMLIGSKSLTRMSYDPEVVVDDYNDTQPLVGRVLSKIIRHRNSENNYSKVIPKNKSEQNAYYKAVRVLQKDGFIIKISKDLYMVNPMMCFPYIPYLPLVLEDWDTRKATLSL